MDADLRQLADAFAGLERALTEILIAQSKTIAGPDPALAMLIAGDLAKDLETAARTLPSSGRDVLLRFAKIAEVLEDGARRRLVGLQSKDDPGPKPQR